MHTLILILAAVGGLIALPWIVRSTKYKILAHKWDRYAVQMLKNTFWRMVTKKAPLYDSPIKQFIEDIWEALPAIKKHLKDSEMYWLREVWILEKQLFFLSYRRHCQNPFFPTEHYENCQEIGLFLGDIFSWIHTLEVTNQQLPKEFQPYTNWKKYDIHHISKEFYYNLGDYISNGYDSLITKGIEPPSELLSSLPRKYWSKRLKFWGEMVSDPIEWSVQELYREIDNLKCSVGYTPETARKIEALEQQVEQVAFKPRKWSESQIEAIKQTGLEKQRRVNETITAISEFLQNCEKDYHTFSTIPTTTTSTDSTEQELTQVRVN